MENQIDLYTGIHKGQRVRFFTISKEAGSIDCADQKAMDRLQEELESFREHMRLHAALEEKFIHPLLSERVPGGSRKLEEDHRIMHQQLDDLVAHFKGVKAKSSDFEKQQELVLEFYRAWNRFTAFYFMHIDYEEEYVQPSLWKLCTSMELEETFRLILADQTPKELMGNLELILPAISMGERISLLNEGRANMPPEAFQAVLKLAEHVLNTADWIALKSKLMIS
jgi:hypothetical protein